jgi:hypothetical protein
MRLLVVGALLGLLGCARSFDPVASPPTPPAKLNLGERCVDAGACGSGLCEDAHCCDRVCETYERCDLGGNAGVCTTVALGTPCDAGSQCDPAGACMDGVCCDHACGPCEVCDRSGQCVHAPVNTDPHSDCLADGGACLACLDGACVPAVRGTDPHAVCGENATCGSSPRCFVTDGGACASDDSCLEASCVGGRCLKVAVTELLAPQMNPNATERIQLHLASDPSGVQAMSFRELELVVSRDGTLIPEDALFAGVRAPGGAWQIAFMENEFTGTEDYVPQSAVMIVNGAVSLLSADVSSSCSSNGHGCGLRSQPLSSRGVAGTATELAPWPDGGRFEHGEEARFVDVVPGQPVVVEGRGADVRFIQPAGDGGWVSTVQHLPQTSEVRVGVVGRALVYQGGPAALVVSSVTGDLQAGEDANGLFVVTPQQVVEVPFARLPCNPWGPSAIDLGAREVPEGVVMTLSCTTSHQGVHQGLLRPVPDGGSLAFFDNGFGAPAWDHARRASEPLGLTLATDHQARFQRTVARVFLFSDGVATPLEAATLLPPSVGENWRVQDLALTTDAEALPTALFNTYDDALAAPQYAAPLFLLSVSR